MKIIKNITLATVLSFSSLSAHSLWINSFESFAHKPGHTTVGIGWGHSLPIDDIPNSANGKVKIESFSITTPKGKTVALRVPKVEIEEVSIKADEFDVYNADIALQKIALKKDSPQGVYTIKAHSTPGLYTQYIDTKDRKRLKFTSKDKIKDIKEILWSVQQETFAKSYLTLGKWEEQKALGDSLEIIPKTDLSNVKVGDIVEFEVLFFGKPLNASAKKVATLNAMSNIFGQGEGFSIASKVKKGKAKFRVQSKGQWIVHCHNGEDVTKEGPLKDLYGKVNKVFHSASLTFNVKE